MLLLTVQGLSYFFPWQFISYVWSVGIGWKCPKNRDCWLWDGLWYRRGLTWWGSWVCCCIYWLTLCASSTCAYGAYFGKHSLHFFHYKSLLYETQVYTEPQIKSWNQLIQHMHTAKTWCLFIKCSWINITKNWQHSLHCRLWILSTMLKCYSQKDN